MPMLEQLFFDQFATLNLRNGWCVTVLITSKRDLKMLISWPLLLHLLQVAATPGLLEQQCTRFWSKWTWQCWKSKSGNSFVHVYNFLNGNVIIPTATWQSGLQSIQLLLQAQIQALVTFWAALDWTCFFPFFRSLNPAWERMSPARCSSLCSNCSVNFL